MFCLLNPYIYKFWARTFAQACAEIRLPFKPLAGNFQIFWLAQNHSHEPKLAWLLKQLLRKLESKSSTCLDLSIPKSHSCTHIHTDTKALTEPKAHFKCGVIFHSNSAAQSQNTPSFQPWQRGEWRELMYSAGSLPLNSSLWLKIMFAPKKKKKERERGNPAQFSQIHLKNSTSRDWE